MSGVSSARACRAASQRLQPRDRQREAALVALDRKRSLVVTGGAELVRHRVSAGVDQSMIRVVAIIAWLLLMLIFGIAAVAAERWAVYETSNGKTRVWREGASEGDTGAIKKSESECRTMLQLAQWSHADDVARHPLPGRSCCCALSLGPTRRLRARLHR